MKVRATKVARLLPRRDLWPTVRKGVVPSVEHMPVPFNLAYKTVIDVGASYGQFASFAAYRFGDARIVSFEPLDDARATIERNLGSRVETRQWALSSRPGRAAFHVATSNDSSSLLSPSELQVQEFPGSESAAETTVDVRTLAEEFTASEIASPSLLKIDVQGAELDVLRGARDLLGAFDDVFVECSFMELYEDQALAGEVIAFMTDHGYRIASITGAATTQARELLQADVLFRRRAG